MISVVVGLYCQITKNGIVGQGITLKKFLQFLEKKRLPEQIDSSEYHDGKDKLPDTSVLAGVDDAERAIFHRSDRTESPYS